MPLKNRFSCSSFRSSVNRYFSFFCNHIWKARYLLIILLTLLLFYYFSLPKNLFIDPTSTILEDREGRLLGAKISPDGQWRFPILQVIPAKFETALLLFEDKRFYFHPGFNPSSLVRAAIQNIRSGHIVSGGSTITMQVVRMMRKNKSRSIEEKIIEIMLATRLEMKMTKRDILQLYCSNAPFGGNVIGLEAASWRYFGRSPADLSWSESATLAILPNSPSLIHPGKNRELLFAKRNRLLDLLYKKRYIDSVSLHLAKLEPLPEKPLPLPYLSPHLLEKAHLYERGNRVRSTIDALIQYQVNQILLRHYQTLKGNEIHNAAALVIDVKNASIIAYAGNICTSDSSNHEFDVDCIQSHRSTGSILKPLLFASMLEDGEILPSTLIPDVPSQFGSFFPKNYDENYDGAIPARRALARSLNVPAVRMLQQHGLEKFHFFLQKLGMKSLVYPSDHYGLSLILGGGECSLLEITSVYSRLSEILNHYYENNGLYSSEDMHEPGWILQINQKPFLRKKGIINSSEPSILSASSIWLTYEALIEVNRPDVESSWLAFGSKYKIAWKTGTSFGNRDAWAIGTTPGYAVGVWVGNANGEGRPLLTGISCAAPVLFDIFNILPPTGWFKQPYDEMVRIPVCRLSGYRAGINCEEIDSIWIQKSGLNTRPCPYHILIHLNPDGRFRVNSKCELPSNMLHKSWFVLPPIMEWYYKSKNPGYKTLPPYAPGCETDPGIRSLELVYPRPGSKIYIPREISGERGRLVMEAIHRNPSGIIFWHIDNFYLGSTRQIHQMALYLQPGKHTLTLIDENGESLSVEFQILDKE